MTEDHQDVPFIVTVHNTAGGQRFYGNLKVVRISLINIKNQYC